MLFDIFSKCYEHILIVLYPEDFEYKTIKRINSTGSLIEYEK
jgi:hypothetical protein